MSRARLAFTGVLLAAAMAGAAVTVAYGLATGFDRSARQADLPDVIVRFNSRPQPEIDRIVSALPNVAARAYRLEITGVGVGSAGGSSEKGSVALVDGRRRGYAIVAGRDVDGRPSEAVIERGVANAWHVRVGDEIQVGRLGSLRVAGIAVSPDNVAFPLASAPRVYISRAWLERENDQRLPVDQALIWAANPHHVDVLLQQARATSTQIQGVRFITRSGVRVLIDSAAGIVIALLIAFSLIALGAAATMLAATTAADVQRRLPAIGVQRTVGYSRARIAAEHASRAVRNGAPAGAAWRRGGRPRGPRRVRQAARGTQRAATGLGAVGRRWPRRSRSSWPSSPPPRHGRRGAPPRARPSRCCAARSWRARGACAWAAASPRSERGWPSRAAAAPPRRSPCWRSAARSCC